MPYINQEIRDALTPRTSVDPGTPGPLNFQITKLIKNYIEINGLCYQNINDVVGALECAKAEFYRRVAAPYEDTKIEENGDVY